jgi:hypothetical protein
MELLMGSAAELFSAHVMGRLSGNDFLKKVIKRQFVYFLRYQLSCSMLGTVSKSILDELNTEFR